MFAALGCIGFGVISGSMTYDEWRRNTEVRRDWDEDKYMSNLQVLNTLNDKKRSELPRHFPLMVTCSKVEYEMHYDSLRQTITLPRIFTDDNKTISIYPSTGKWKEDDFFKFERNLPVHSEQETVVNIFLACEFQANSNDKKFIYSDIGFAPIYFARKQLYQLQSQSYGGALGIVIAPLCILGGFAMLMHSKL